jgi:chromate reductase
MTKIIAFSGSIRSGSLNQKLVNRAVMLFQERKQNIELISLADYDLPIYNGDIEKDAFPVAATRLFKKFQEADGFVIASPEYNSSFSPLLKNAIDWVSRPQDNAPPLAAVAGKTAMIISASMGPLGGIRGLYQLRWVLENIAMHVSPSLMSLPVAHQAFDDAGNIKDEKYMNMLTDSVTQMINLTAKLKG